MLSATYYVRALSGLLIVSEVLHSLMFEAFSEANQYDGLLCIQDVALDLRAALSDKSRDRSTVKLDELGVCGKIRAL